jgi:hypothetical protein
MPKIDARVKLTKRTVDVRDARGDRIVWDTELPGFGIRARNGRKLFVFQYGARGRTRRMTLGTYGTLTCESAREDSRRAHARLAAFIRGGGGRRGLEPSHHRCTTRTRNRRRRRAMRTWRLTR